MLGHSFEGEDVLLNYKDASMKLVNSELGQKRSQVNQALLKRWKGKYRAAVLLKRYFLFLSLLLFLLQNALTRRGCIRT